MMSKAKWFVVRKPSTGEIIATSANQIVPPKFGGPTKMLYYIHQTPFPLAALKGGLGTRLGQPVMQTAQPVTQMTHLAVPVVLALKQVY